MLRKIKKWWVLSLIHTVLPVALTFFLFILSYYYFLFPAIESNLLDSRRLMIRELTTSACNLIEEYEIRFQMGEFTKVEAMERAKARIRAMRYGPENKDYFWISDTLPQMIMHPYRPDMEGQELSSYTDSHGNFLFMDMISVVEDSGSGYIDYFWQWKDSPDKISPKVSYVQYFEPWAWIIGTGLYVEDVDANLATITNPLKHIYAIILFFLVLLAAYMIVQSGKIENQRLIALTKLRESEEKFRMIFNSLFNHIGLLNPDGRIIEMNQSGLELAKQKNDEIAGISLTDSPWWNLSSKNKLKLEDALKKCEEEKLVRFQAQNKLSDGEMIDVDVTLKVISNSLDQVQMIILESRDITELKHAEREMKALIQALEEQKSELERFTYTVSHDLKSPLITIKGFLGLLEKDIEQNDAEQIFQDIGRINNAVNKMESLLKDLLELSRIGRIINMPEEIAVSELVKDAQELSAGLLSDNNVTLKIQDSLPQIRGDGERLREVMVNLLSNAAKFMGTQENPIIEVGTDTIEGESCIFVKDNGIGIQKEYQDQIFGLFEKLDHKASGTGIGLAIVKRIVEVHGGRIWVESDGLGMGSTFYFTLNGNS